MDKRMYVKNWVAKKSPLPSGVVPLKYLESTGVQWIDTGIMHQDGQKYDIVAWYAPDANVGGRLFGTARAGWTNAGRVDITLGLKDFQTFFGEGLLFRGNISQYAASIREPHEYSIIAKNGDASFSIDGIKVVTGMPNALNSPTLRTVALFCIKTSYPCGFAQVRISNFRMTLGTTANLAYIPALYPAGLPYIDGNTLQTVTPSTDKPGMYDAVSGHFFVNQGTGSDFLYELA